MPLPPDYYYGSLPSYYSPYSSPYSNSPYSYSRTPIIGYSPLTALLSASIGVNSIVPRRNYIPYLSSISESSPSTSPVLKSRTFGNRNSPRSNSSASPLSYFRRQKPVIIDTDNIDVSSPRDPNKEKKDSVSMSGPIQRGRTVVRMLTKKLKENPGFKKKKKTPGELLVEKFLIRDKNTDEVERHRKDDNDVYNNNPSDVINLEESDNQNKSGLTRRNTIKRHVSCVKKKSSGSLPINEVNQQSLKNHEEFEPADQTDVNLNVDDDNDPSNKIRRLSVTEEMLKEQEAILDSLIMEELSNENKKEIKQLHSTPSSRKNSTDLTSSTSFEDISYTGTVKRNHTKRKTKKKYTGKKSSKTLPIDDVINEMNATAPNGTDITSNNKSNDSNNSVNTVMINEDSIVKQDSLQKSVKRPTAKRKRSTSTLPLKFIIDDITVEESIELPVQQKPFRKLNYEVIIEELMEDDTKRDSLKMKNNEVHNNNQNIKDINHNLLLNEKKKTENIVVSTKVDDRCSNIKKDIIDKSNENSKESNSCDIKMVSDNIKTTNDKEDCKMSNLENKDANKFSYNNIKNSFTKQQSSSKINDDDIEQKSKTEIDDKKKVNDNVLTCDKKIIPIEKDKLQIKVFNKPVENNIKLISNSDKKTSVDKTLKELESSSSNDNIKTKESGITIIENKKQNDISKKDISSNKTNVTKQNSTSADTNNLKVKQITVGIIQKILIDNDKLDKENDKSSTIYDNVETVDEKVYNKSLTVPGKSQPFFITDNRNTVIKKEINKSTETKKSDNIIDINKKEKSEDNLSTDNYKNEAKIEMNESSSELVNIDKKESTVINKLSELKENKTELSASNVKSKQLDISQDNKNKQKNIIKENKDSLINKIETDRLVKGNNDQLNVKTQKTSLNTTNTLMINEKETSTSNKQNDTKILTDKVKDKQLSTNEVKDENEQKYLHKVIDDDVQNDIKSSSKLSTTQVLNKSLSVERNFVINKKQLPDILKDANISKTNDSHVLKNKSDEKFNKSDKTFVNKEVKLLEHTDVKKDTKSTVEIKSTRENKETENKNSTTKNDKEEIILEYNKKEVTTKLQTEVIVKNEKPSETSKIVKKSSGDKISDKQNTEITKNSTEMNSNKIINSNDLLTSKLNKTAPTKGVQKNNSNELKSELIGSDKEIENKNSSSKNDNEEIIIEDNKKEVTTKLQTEIIIKNEKQSETNKIVKKSSGDKISDKKQNTEITKKSTEMKSNKILNSNDLPTTSKLNKATPTKGVQKDNSNELKSKFTGSDKILNSNEASGMISTLKEKLKIDKKNLKAEIPSPTDNKNSIENTEIKSNCNKEIKNIEKNIKKEIATEKMKDANNKTDKIKTDEEITEIKKLETNIHTKEKTTLKDIKETDSLNKLKKSFDGCGKNNKNIISKDDKKLKQNPNKKTPKEEILDNNSSCTEKIKIKSCETKTSVVSEDIKMTVPKSNENKEYILSGDNVIDLKESNCKATVRRRLTKRKTVLSEKRLSLAKYEEQRLLLQNKNAIIAPMKSTITGDSVIKSDNSDIEDSSSEKDDSEEESDDTSTSEYDSDSSDCDVNCHRKCEKLMPNLCGINQKLLGEALTCVKRGSAESRDHASGSPTRHFSNTALGVDNLGKDLILDEHCRVTPPATTLPRFRKYTIQDFQFLKVLGKGSFGKVLLAELQGTENYYAVKCLKKDIVLEDDDVECTLIERKVLALGTNHPYLCHLFCTFQTESHLFFVMEYLNGGDLMFHIQQSGRFDEGRARFYASEIVSGLMFLHKKGIVYRDLKLDNILLDFDGHVRIADFGMCKLQIYLDRTADTFCGTPDYMAPEIIKGLRYNQCVDWWSFGILLYEMLVGQSPFSGCDEDELFWSICNEQPHYPKFLTSEAKSILTQLLEKDSSKRLGSTDMRGGEVTIHPFFRNWDWARLERREIEPPFKPRRHPLDVQYFDKAFTNERPRLTPVDKTILQSMDQTQFQGFSYTNPNVTE
ncbi:uncharacterized protein LOC142333012 isoform X2 [Lycorma delicatula]|uniref:uncharacterized protein LOC142333012 isoform X2 n=1 Tax=Lycorma delicatula TaxID=130591 RepID=UPI003F51A774